MIVTIDDVRAAGLCVAGARRWFAHHGLDFEGFLREGLPVATLRALHDALADQVCDAVEARAP